MRTIDAAYHRRLSKNFLVRVARPTVFLDKKTLILMIKFYKSEISLLKDQNSFLKSELQQKQITVEKLSENRKIPILQFSKTSQLCQGKKQ